MKSLNILLSLIILISIKSCKSAAIESQTEERGDDYYRFSYRLDDGTARYEEGILDEKHGAKFYKVSGFYNFFGTDGKEYVVNYIADERGYHATTNGENFKVLFGKVYMFMCCLKCSLTFW